MSFNITAIELGNLLGTNIAKASDYKQDFIESQEVTDINLVPIDNIKVTGVWFVKKYFIASDSFVLDHPVQGALDSAIFKLDGGYFGATAPNFPFNFPLPFDTGEDTYELWDSGTL